MTEDHTQGITAANADNLYVADRRPVSPVEEPTTFMTREVEVMLKREKEKALVSLVCLDLKPPLAVKSWESHIQWGTLLQSSRSSMEEEEVRSLPRFYGTLC